MSEFINMLTDSDIDGLVKERRNSITNALDLRLRCTNPSIWRNDLAIVPTFSFYVGMLDFVRS